MLGPVAHSFFQAYSFFLHVRGEVSDFIRWVILSTVYVGQHAGYQRSAPLSSHHRVQVSVSGAVLSPDLILPETQVFSGISNGSSTNAVEDEFTPELIFGAELVVFPKSFTS